MPKRKGRGGAKAARKKALGMSLVRNKRRVAQERRVAAKSGYVLAGGQATLALLHGTGPCLQDGVSPRGPAWGPRKASFCY